MPDRHQKPADLIIRPEMGSYRGLPQFGQRVTVKAGVAEGTVTPVLQPDQFPSIPSVMTVNLSRAENNQAGNAKPIAQIEARCGGITYTFYADWSYGQAISLCCDGLTVSAKMVKRTDGLGYIDDVPFILVATIAWGTVPNRVTLTDLQVEIGPGFPAFHVWNVPPFAQAVFFNLQGDAGASTNGTGCWDDDTLVFATDVGPTINAKQLSRSIPSFWTLPASCVSVQASAPNNPVNVIPIWELAL